jgi:signal transduction histidine kinase
MRSSKKPWEGKSRLLRNPHFWIITCIVLVLSAIYHVPANIVELKWDWVWYLVVFEFKNNVVGSLFLIPFIYAAIVFWWRGILITWLISMALILPRVQDLSEDASAFIANIIYLCIPLLIVLTLDYQKKWRESVKKSSHEREKERQAYISQIIKVQEDERKRISREIHDDTVQRLWIVTNSIKRLISDKLDSGESDIAIELGTITETIESISADAKRLSIDLRPGILDDLGLVPAIRWEVDQLNSEGFTEAKIQVIGIQRQFAPEINIHLFRIVQEALHNIRQHAAATEVTVTLEFNPEDIKITIKDNGKGFEFRDLKDIAKMNKLGLLGIQERMRLIGGNSKIDSKPGKGTTISVTLPYKSLAINFKPSEEGLSSAA